MHVHVTSAIEIVLPIVFGLGTGVLGAVLGTGGGVFLVPLLILGLGVSAHSAIATSILSVIATSSAVASVNVERGTANMRLGMTLEVATALGAICGSWAAQLLAARALEAVFAIVLLPTAAVMWRRRGEAIETSVGSSGASGSANGRGEDLGQLGACYHDPIEGEVTYRVRRLSLGMAISYCAGMVSGLLGIGGGVFKVPALHLACGVPMKAAAATSNFMIGVTAAAGAFVYYGAGDVRPVLTASVVLGVIGGSALGSILNRFLPSAILRRLFGALLVLVAVAMLFRALGGGR